MTLKTHAKFEEKLTCGSENNMRHLANFHQNTWKCQNWYFHGILLSNVDNVWAENLQRSYVSWHWRMVQNLKRNWLVGSKLTWGIWRIWPDYLKISKICTLMGCFWPKYILFNLKKYRGVMLDGTEDECKIWTKRELCFLKWHENLANFHSQAEK